MRYGLGFVVACVVLYAIAMEGVHIAAKEIVATFGAIGGLLTILAMYGAARFYERRQERQKVEILPPSDAASR